MKETDVQDHSLPDETETNLDALWATWATGSHSLCAQAPGGQFRTVGFFDEFEDLLAAADQLNGHHNVWFGVHGVQDVPKKGRGGAADVAWVRALSADFDWADDTAHENTELPSELDVRLAVSVMEPKPNVVINSGHGLQAYWTLEDSIPASEAQPLIDGFFRYIEATYGLHNDRADLASILRVPGTTNLKGDPVRVTVEYADTQNGWQSAWIRQNAWLPEPVAEVIPIRSSVAATQLNSHVPRETSTEDSPLDWLNDTFDAYAAWQRLGWQAGPRSGSSEEMTRPGKSKRAGTSATFHHDSGLLNIYSTAVDPLYEQIGLRRAGCLTFKPADAWMVENGITDRSEAARAARQQMPTTRPAQKRADAEPEPEQVEASVAGLNLPPEFWEARPWLTHIRDAAWSRGMSPDAVLGAVLSRYATAVPPTYQIPPIVGAPSTFDHMSILVAESAQGKSASMTIARELWSGPLERKDIVWDFPTPSGEGLVQAFFEMVTEDDGGKKKQVNRKTKTAVHFSVDEAMALIESGSRQGATIGSVITAAWTGGNPGQGNASADRQRVGMNPGTFRMSGLAAIQTSLGAAFLADAYVRQGLSGRLIFFHATDPNLPDWRKAPIWPGELELPVHPSVPTVIGYATEIQETVKDEHQAKQRGEVVVPPIDGHLNLVRLKLAGLVALMDGHRSVDMGHWAIAQQIVDVHVHLRHTLQAVQQQQQRDEGHKRAAAAAIFEMDKDDIQHRRGVASLRETIIRKVPSEGIVKKVLRDAVTNSRTRSRFNEALAAALHDGAIKVENGRYFPG